MNRLLPPFRTLLIAAWLVAVTLCFLVGVPGQGLAWSVLLDGLRAGAVALAWGVGCVGTGGFLLSHLRPALLQDDLGWVRAGVAGLGVAGLLCLGWAALTGLHPWGAALLPILLAAAWLDRPLVEGRRPTTAAIGLLLLALTPGLLVLLAPVTDTDELYYHLALPRRMLEQGALLGGPWQPNGSRPLALHLPWAAMMVLGGEAAPRAFHLLVSATILWFVHVRAHARWGQAAGLVAPFLLAGSATFLRETGLAYDDLPAALAVLVAVDAALAEGGLPLVALASGTALAIKYTALFPLAPLFGSLAIGALRARDESPFRKEPPRKDLRFRRLGAVILAGLAALLLVAPWWLRNALDGLHPLFPFTGWEGPITFQYDEKYGLTHDLAGWVLLPWNMVMRADTTSFLFLGRLHPLFLGLLPPACLAAWRWRDARLCLGISAAGLLLWAAGPQWLRYLLPLLPVAALGLSAGAKVLPSALLPLVFLAGLAGLPANLAPILAATADQAPAALSWEDRESFLARKVPGWNAIRWINRQTPPDARVALLYCWPAWHVERSWVLGSVEDHVPSRYLLQRAGVDALSVLKEQGVSYLLVEQVHFIRKSYPFLDQATFEQDFVKPSEDLQSLLKQGATMVFQEERWSVWRLDDQAQPPGAATPG